MILSIMDHDGKALRSAPVSNEDFLRLLIRAEIHLWDAADTALRTEPPR